MNLYVDDFSRPGKHLLKFPAVAKIFKYPRGHWLVYQAGTCPKKISNSVRRLMKRAAPSLPVLVLYAIPNRDNGNHSSGGAEGAEEYLEILKAVKDGLDNSNPIMIIEPDALALSSENEDELSLRLKLIDEALNIFDTCKTYVDIGHPNWLHYERAAEILNKLTRPFTGFSVNVSNFVPLDQCLVWAEKVSSMTGKTCVIDTSRNGRTDHNGEWCNPKGKILGVKPTFNTAFKFVDAYLWIKVPGESDGRCNGGPNAGAFWPEYAIQLLEGFEDRI